MIKLERLEYLCGRKTVNSFWINKNIVKTTFMTYTDSKGRFHFYSGISRFSKGSALYQIQNGKPNLKAYTYKRIPEVARNYSITELKLCGLGTNIVNFAYLFIRTELDITFDPLALKYKNKVKQNQLLKD